MSIRKKRVLISAILIAAGVTTGWLTFNLGLDYLLGGRTFG